MLGTVAVLKTNMARNAKVEVFASSAGNEARLWECCNDKISIFVKEYTVDAATHMKCTNCTCEWR
jgi:hypothetical protein